MTYTLDDVLLIMQATNMRFNPACIEAERLAAIVKEYVR